MTTVAQVILNSTLPEGHTFTGPVTAKHMTEVLTRLAKENPSAYVKSVEQLKRVGDAFATDLGISVGLDDIEPQYEERNTILDEHQKKLDIAKTNEEKIEILSQIQDKLKSLTQSHPGSLVMQTKSGGRGNINQALKIINGPVAVTDPDGDVVPYLIHHSYAEGLTPGEGWIAGNEARVNVIQGKSSVVLPGDVSKMFVATMYNQVISGSDCGTHNGILVPATDTLDMRDRYLAKDTGKFKRNTLITSQVADEIKKIGKPVMVRSPMTCNLINGGVCQHCYGLDEKGNSHSIGTNVGVRSAQALTEPLTQMALSAKHSTKLAKGKSSGPSGIAAVSNMVNVSQSFLNAATQAKHDGIVTDIKTAPQGGHYIYVGDTQHYASPGLEILVKKGDEVEAGDTLSDGIPKPSEIVEHKGLGVGRKYFVDALHNVYKKAGVDVDKRHLELLAKADINHVKIERDDSDHFIPGSVVSYPELKDRLQTHTENIPVENAKGKILAEEIMNYSAGTKLTPKVIKDIKQHQDKVDVAVDPPEFKFFMSPLSQTPLLNPDWMANLGYRHLKDTLEHGAHFGAESDIHGNHPLPGFIYGLEFGNGEGGAY